MALHRTWREGRYNQLCDAVYKRRGWTNNAIPTLETLKKFKIDFPEVVEVVRPHLTRAAEDSGFRIRASGQNRRVTNHGHNDYRGCLRSCAGGRANAPRPHS